MGLGRSGSQGVGGVRRVEKERGEQVERDLPELMLQSIRNSVYVWGRVYVCVGVHVLLCIRVHVVFHSRCTDETVSTETPKTTTVCDGATGWWNGHVCDQGVGRHGRGSSVTFRGSTRTVYGSCPVPRWESHEVPGPTGKGRTWRYTPSADPWSNPEGRVTPGELLVCVHGSRCGPSVRWMDRGTGPHRH